MYPLRWNVAALVHMVSFTQHKLFKIEDKRRCLKLIQPEHMGGCRFTMLPIEQKFL